MTLTIKLLEVVFLALALVFGNVITHFIVSATEVIDPLKL